MSISQNFVNLRPSLLLDFANSEILDPRITFSRPTTATYYDGVSSALAEQNLLLQSNTFTNAAWVKTNGTVASGVTDPAGGTTAFSFTATAANATLYQTLTLTATPYTNSFWIQRVTGTGTINLTLDGTTLNPVTITGSWAKYQATATPTAASHTIGIQVTTSGDVINIFGSQLENRSSATATNITTTAALNNYIPVLQTAASNQARFDHDPVTRTSLGLLIEQQSTNLLTYSSDYTNAVWNKTNLAITSSANIAPDGTQTANLFVPNTTSGLHFINQIIATSTDTVSIYAKANGYSWLCFLGFGGRAYFNVSTGTIGSFSSPFNAPTITSVGNGWYRCSVNFGTQSNVNCGFAVANADQGSGQNPNNYAGDGYSGMYIWGAQCEALAFTTSYIPTVASQVTRSADSASMTGTNFSSWFNQSQGSFYAEGKCNGLGYQGSHFVFLNSATVSNSYLQFVAQNTATQSQTYWAQNFSNLIVTNNGINSSNKEAMSWTSTLLTQYNNGVTTGSIAGTLRANQLDQMSIGYRNTYSDGYMNGTIKKIAFYPATVTSAQLQALTGS